MLAISGIYHTSCLPILGHQTINCPSIRYIFPAKILPALLLCQKNWFWSKILLDDFYPFLRSIASSWIHIGVKIFSRPAVCITWNIWTKICKTQLWGEKKTRHLFLDHVVCIIFNFNRLHFYWSVYYCIHSLYHPIYQYTNFLIYLSYTYNFRSWKS